MIHVTSRKKRNEKLHSKPSYNKNLVKTVSTILLSGLALSTMGNTGCNQQAKPPARVLKKIVEAGKVGSPPVQFPDGTGFDFEYVATQQMASVFMESAFFTLRTVEPITVNPISGASVTTADISGRYNLQSSDAQMFRETAAGAGIKNLNPLVLSPDAWCMANIPQFRMDANVNAFEMIGGGGATIGFGPGGNFPLPGAGLSFDLKYFQLDMSFHAMAPATNTKDAVSTILGAVNVDSKQTRTQVSITIPLKGINFTPNYYSSTPLAKVTKTGLTIGASGLGTQLSKFDWSSRVLLDADNFVIIIGGHDVGIEEGDEFDIFNVKYIWEGESCKSRLLGDEGADGSSFVAKIRIKTVSNGTAKGEVILRDSIGTKPVLGALVKLSKFHDPIVKPAAQ